MSGPFVMCGGCVVCRGHSPCPTGTVEPDGVMRCMIDGCARDAAPGDDVCAPCRAEADRWEAVDRYLDERKDGAA